MSSRTAHTLLNGLYEARLSSYAAVSGRGARRVNKIPETKFVAVKHTDIYSTFQDIKIYNIFLDRRRLLYTASAAVVVTVVPPLIAPRPIYKRVRRVLGTHRRSRQLLGMY